VERPLSPLTEEHEGELAERQWRKTNPETGPKSYRTPQQRDRDRVLYSSALQRLAYVTQVTASESGHIFHNRLSHSLKVAQVGRRNAERLRTLVARGEISGGAARMIEALDPDAVEASCLAHDLGHPPYGHIAEQVLHEKAVKYLRDGFEGNAQSFRIVTRLSVRDEKPGMDLTRQTLNGLLKYPWRRWPADLTKGQKRKWKWGAYEDDLDALAFARKGWPPESPYELPRRCLEAEIMDWADDLTYAVHDVDDFFRAGLIPLDRLAATDGTELKHLETLLVGARSEDPHGFPEFETERLARAAQVAASRAASAAPYRHTHGDRGAMREFGSRLITEYLEAFSVQNAASGVKLVIDDRAHCEVEALKMLVRVYVIRRPSLAVVQQGQMRVVAELFDRYFEAAVPPAGGGNRHLFPPGAGERLEKEGTSEAKRARITVDLISGLTETAAVKLHNRLTGGWVASALDATAAIG
jgi:dGTPase